MTPNEFLSLLRRHWLALAACLAVGIGAAVWHSATAEKSYIATSRSIINIPAARGIQEALAGAQLSGQLLGTYAQVASSRQVAERVIADLALNDTPERLQREIGASARSGTFLIDIAVKDSNPIRAARIADAAARALSRTVDDLERGKADPIQAQLLDRASVPTRPVSPKPRTDLLLGFVLGAVAGLGLVLALEGLDRSIKSPDQGSAAFGAPLLGMVPRRRHGLSLVAVEDERSSDAEAVRSIRTAVRFLDPDHPPRILLVTSPGPAEGKTSVSANLALTLAQGGERVVLVDADLRKAALTDLLGLERAVGLSTVLSRDVPLADAIQRWGDVIDVIAAGRLPPNPSELLGSEAMSAALEQLATSYDVVLIDGPPVLPVTDAVVLSTQVDVVLVLARYGRTARAAASEAARRVAAVGGKIGGFVLNAVPPNDSRAYYAAYGYGNDQPKAPADTAGTS